MKKQKEIAWNFSPRTDLAIEARELAQEQKQNTEELDGVKVEIKNTVSKKLKRENYLYKLRLGHNFLFIFRHKKF